MLPQRSVCGALNSWPERAVGGGSVAWELRVESMMSMRVARCSLSNCKVTGEELRVGSEGKVLIEECSPETCAVVAALADRERPGSLQPSLEVSGASPIPTTPDPRPLIEGTAECCDDTLALLSGGSNEMFVGGTGCEGDVGEGGRDGDGEQRSGLLGWEAVVGSLAEPLLLREGSSGLPASTRGLVDILSLGVPLEERAGPGGARNRTVPGEELRTVPGEELRTCPDDAELAMHLPDPIVRRGPFGSRTDPVCWSGRDG